MNIAILQHVASEGPGTLGSYLVAGERIFFRFGCLGGFPAVARVRGCRGFHGGPISVYDEEEYPFLRMETDFLREALAARIPVLGVCLGGPDDGQGMRSPDPKGARGGDRMEHGDSHPGGP